MNFSQWLDEEEGRLTAVAAHFKVTKSAVSQWRTKGIPSDRMMDVRGLTAGRVSLEEMLAPSSSSEEAA